MIENTPFMAKSSVSKATIRLSDVKRRDILAFIPEHSLLHGKGVEYGRVITWMLDAAWPLFAACQFDPKRVESAIEQRPIKDWLYRLYEATPRDRRGAFRAIAEAEKFEAPPEAFDEGKGVVSEAANAGVGRKPEPRRNR